jgi:dipeptidyl aminopeptidase/acylaminoacyl peptidase
MNSEEIMRKVFLIFLLIPSFLFAQEKRAMNVEDIWLMERINSFDLSPDGKKIVFSASNFSLELNKGNSDIFIIDTDGSNLKGLKTTEKNESEPKFSPDGRKISYLIGGQLWLSDIDGSNEEQMTDFYPGISGHEWSPDGSRIMFVSSVYPECATPECVKQRDEKKEANPVKASIFSELMYRHWNDWRGDKRSHLFIYDLNKKEFIDVTLGSKFDVPPISLGSSNDYNFSPDGNWVSFTMNTDENLATSTNNDIFVANIENITAGQGVPHEKISNNQGNDNQPVFSPDGRFLAYTSMKRPGFEADKQTLVIFDLQNKTENRATENIDVSVYEFIWSPDSKTIFFTAANEIYNSIYKLDIESSEVSVLLKEHVNSSLIISPDGSTLYFRHQRSDLPYEIFSINTDGSNLRQITFLNSKRLAGIEMNPAETFWSPGADGARVQSILIKPPFFNPAEEYAMIFLIHGGPQGHWRDEFHYRWNMQLFASRGYVVVAPNPRGSTGYGQQFTDEISQDWAGKVYTDLMNAYDYAIENFSFIDGNNTFAAGASYGGYMINWIAGHTDRFNALVSHAGVFNLESMYGTTEELWFPEWEFGGTPWENRELYEKWSPHRYIHNAKTPVLVVHGANDFRVSEEQGMQLFTSLQRLGVDSQFLYFPDETHFVSKPRNSVLWWNTIFGWFNRYYEMEIQ